MYLYVVSFYLQVVPVNLQLKMIHMQKDFAKVSFCVSLCQNHPGTSIVTVQLDQQKFLSN